MIQKQAIDVSFAQGLDQKTDKKRVQIGKFLSLQNTVFQKGGLLQKRNGYGLLPALPDTTYSYVTTLKDNLTAIGSNIAALNKGGSGWVQKGAIQPLSLKTLPLIRNNLNQTACDAAVAPNGLVCTVYLESDGTTTTNKYAIADSVTGQNIVAPTAIPIASGAVSGGMRVFVLGTKFVIIFTNTITAVQHLQYVAVSYNNPTNVSANTDIAASYIGATTLAWDAYVVNNALFIAYNTTSGGQAVKVTYLTSTLVLAAAVSFATYKATMMSVTADMTVAANPVIYVSWYRLDTTVGYTAAVDTSLNQLLAPTQIIASGTILNLTSVAQNGSAKIFYEVSNQTFDPSIPANYVSSVSITLAGSVGSVTIIIRSVGLASKAFLISGVAYFLSSYCFPNTTPTVGGLYTGTGYQPTYFLINGSSSLSSAPVIAGKLAYQNGGGYLTTGLPGVTLNGSAVWVPYLFKDQIQAVNKNTAVPSGTQTAGIYSQTGVNLATFTLGTSHLDTAEIGNDLHISGGFLWMYDGYLPVEHNFLLWGETDLATPAYMAAWSATGGSIVAKPDGLTNTNAYYYVYTYEWTDNQGNAFRSAPSIPIAVTTTGAGSAGSIQLNLSTLRLTMKTANPVKIVLYRWSVGQPLYYQVTSITSPILNSTTVDYINYVDTLADATILGNNLLYTTGGVVEDINAPASDTLALFDTRLWLVDAEDRNLLWFSKQVIEATPVEMSDLFTLYVPPTVGTATGEITSTHPMDDKLIISKGGNSLVYINGTGPDNTGANNQYSQPIFITSTVGCANQKSMVVVPQGLMFQSNKGIWLLDRGLGTSYIGAPVEDFTTGATVLSAVVVPETNQVRFTLDTGVTLMYDYYYDQWGSFVGVPCLSSCIYEDLHTFLDSHGRAFQETPGAYLDGSRPVLIQFQTGPLRLGDLQGYQRAYFFYLLGDYLSPHKLAVNLFYNYSTSPSSGTIITPDNYTAAYGSGPSPYGQENPYGGPGIAEEWRVFFKDQRCKAVSISVQEIFDASLGVRAGAGLTLSGINIVLGFKKGFVPMSSARSVGAN